VLNGGHSGYVATLKHVTFSEDATEVTSGMQYGRFTRNSDGHPLAMMVAWFWNVPLITDTLFATPSRPLPADFLVWEF
jgi:hypothetical protein